METIRIDITMEFTDGSDKLFSAFAVDDTDRDDILKHASFQAKRKMFCMLRVRDGREEAVNPDHTKQFVTAEDIGSLREIAAQSDNWGLGDEIKALADRLEMSLPREVLEETCRVPE